ncbi:MAG TPA: alpha/beta hydrolase [Candidatus Saccharimonadales bacterium]|nr:alpha/beta hydrolase [Candidatus Saccharimonadales bacterium]
MHRTKWLETTVSDRALTLAYTDISSEGTGLPTVYFHGWGCTKADFEGAEAEPNLAGRWRLAVDFPGHGDSPYLKEGSITMNDLIQGMHDVITTAGMSRFALVGHSVGNLVAIRYAQRYPGQVAGLVNVVGNMTANDCFMTAEVAADRTTRNDLIARFQNSDNVGFRRYAEGLASVNERAFVDLAKIAVQQCESGEMLNTFRHMHFFKLFLYGEEDVHTLDYLRLLEESGVPVEKIAHSSHFPGIDNPADYYSKIGEFMVGLDEAFGYPTPRPA